jgi:hypothetical protein
VAPFRGFGNRFLSSGGSCGGGGVLLLLLFSFYSGVLVPSEFLFAVSLSTQQLFEGSSSS